MSTFLKDMVNKGYTKKEVLDVFFESERERKRGEMLTRITKTVAAHRIKQMREFLMYEKLAIWRRENGFDRVVEGEESCFVFIARFRPLRNNTMPTCGQR